VALYVPDPERTIEDLVEDLAAELADRYREAEDELIRQVAIRAVRDMALSNELPTAGDVLTLEQLRRQNRVLAELAAHRARATRELTTLAVQIASKLRPQEEAARLVHAAAAEGEASAAARLGFARRPPVGNVGIPLIGGAASVSSTTLTGTATQAVAALVLNLQSRLEVLQQRITRYPQDAYQRIVSLYSPNTLLGITTSREMQARAVQRFLAEGITGFVDQASRRWTIGAYAEMAGRTSVARAYNDAGVWRMRQSGLNLGTITGSLDACKRCAPWIGKIVSLDGTPAGDATVPHATLNQSVTVHVEGTLDEARAAGWGHPNDRCKVVSYAPGLAIPQADFEYNERAEKQRAEQRRLERELRAARRREVSAMNDTDRRKAAGAVRDAQAELREFTRDTGRRRDYAREQLRFADG
jgi:hypothetical protein